MGLADEIHDGELVAFDANALIYYVEAHVTFLPLVDPVFEMIFSGRIEAAVSHLVLAEVLVKPFREGLDQIADAYRSLLNRTRGIRLVSLARVVAERVAFIRARHGLRTPDAIIAASALEAGCSHLVTNDPAFRRVEQLNVLVISEYA